MREIENPLQTAQNEGGEEGNKVEREMNGAGRGGPGTRRVGGIKCKGLEKGRGGVEKEGRGPRYDLRAVRGLVLLLRRTRLLEGKELLGAERLVVDLGRSLDQILEVSPGA